MTFRLAIVAMFLLLVAGTARAAEKVVSIRNLSFTPAQITVNVGDTVVWRNEDDRDHTVMADDKSFRSDNIKPKGSFAHTFSKKGTFSYSCSYHPRMKGTVVVQ
jgi:plastocyanin